MMHSYSKLAIALALVVGCQANTDATRSTTDTQRSLYAANAVDVDPEPDPDPQPDPGPEPDPDPQFPPPPNGWIDAASAGAVRLQIGARDDASAPLQIRLEDPELSDRYQIFIDADGDPGTGIQPGQWPATGADYVIENGTLYTTSEETGWTIAATSKPLTPQFVNGGLELQIQASDLPGLSQDMQLGLGFIKQPPSTTGGSAPLLVLPQTQLWRTPPKWAGGGMIIPAYISATSPEWGDLAKQAGVVAKSTSNRKDFWVVMNGNSGPYEDRGLIDTARANAKSIQTNGGKVFGYVHACNSSMRADGTFTCGSLLSAASVTAKVDEWLSDVPSLDGIWLDEFNPQFDVGVQKQGSQFLPAGGTLATITSRIRGLKNSAERSLLIIGNVGSPLLSDRLKYAALVDVLCTFESTGDELKQGIVRQAVRPSYGQLALVHTLKDGTELPNILETVFSAGFSHVFVGSGDIASQTAWRGNPTYLADEVLLVSPP